MFPVIDETRKQKFRRKSLILYQNSSPRLPSRNMLTLFMSSKEINTDCNFHQAKGSLSTPSSPSNSNNFNSEKHEFMKGHYLWRKATETLALPLLHVKVKEKQRLRTTLMRQVTLKKLFITQVNMIPSLSNPTCIS